MVVEPLTANSIWHNSPAPPPLRSRLYPLAPYGVGTADVESLTSYVARLATKHRVPTGVLLGQIVAPLVNPAATHQTHRTAHLFFQTFFANTGAWNGTGNMAFSSVQALATLTLQPHLDLLTLLTWRDVLPYRGLLRAVKAWCPVCYWEWDNCSSIIRESLLWSFKMLTACPYHQQPLQQQCPYCQQLIFPLQWNSRPGYCSSCHQWLGAPSATGLQKAAAWDDSEWEWQTFAWKNLGEVLAAAPSLTAPPLRQNLTLTLNHAINALTHGNLKAFANLLSISNSVPRDWRSGRAIPQLHLLLRLCYILQLPLLQFLLGQVIITAPCQLKSLPTSQRQRQKNRPFNAIQIQTALETALESYPPLPMKQVALGLGYYPGDLSKFFPDLCRDISARYRSYKLTKTDFS